MAECVEQVGSRDGLAKVDHVGRFCLACVRARLDHAVVRVLVREKSLLEVTKRLGTWSGRQQDHGTGHIMLPRALYGHALMLIRRS